MHLRKNVSLKLHNTFGVDVNASYFLSIHNKKELKEVSENVDLPGKKYIIGGGSNILLTQDLEGLCLHNQLKGIEVVKEDQEHVWVQVASGEKWHDFVLYCVDNDWSGVENLALIPGTVGAAPVQNIGAYGVEVGEVIESVTAWHWKKKEFITYSNLQCQFAYRESIFKKALKDKVFITDVVFKLNKKNNFKVDYGDIQGELKRAEVKTLSIKAISNAVIAIRSRKLPDWKELGNAGSFFKNPILSLTEFNIIQKKYPDLPHYPVDENAVKIPAAWLIEQCGFKGFRKGQVGIHDQQALVLVNLGKATGNEIWEFSKRVIEKVKKTFGVALEREVQVW